MIALWYGILAFMLTTYIVLDGRWHPSLGRHAQSSRTTAGDRSGTDLGVRLSLRHPRHYSGKVNVSKNNQGLY
jgi:hypothetical protein